jgi:RNA-binding protein YhbY
VSISTQHVRSGVKIIVAFEDEYRAYQGALAAAIRILRPDANVMTVDLEKLSAVAKDFRPDIVIGSRFENGVLDEVPAWIELALDPTQLTKVRVDGQYSEVVNPTLDRLLEIIEGVTQPKLVDDP